MYLNLLWRIESLFFLMKSYQKEVFKEIRKRQTRRGRKNEEEKDAGWREALVSFWSGICIYLPQSCMYLGIGQTARNTPANM